MDNFFFSYFNNQVLTNAKKVAVSFKDKNLSYKDLELLSDKIAINLIHLYQVKTNDVIGVFMDKSELAVAMILGIVKSGASFVLIDGNQPPVRRNYIIQNSNCRLVILNEVDVDLDVPTDYVQSFLDQPLNHIELDQPSGNDTAYIVYTSGTTGLPKGSIITYEGLTNMAKSQSDILGFKNTDALLQFASFSFDAAIAEIFETLISGATLVIPAKDETKDINYLHQLLIKKNVTILTVTPSFLTSIKPYYLDSLRILLIVGEQLHSNIIDSYIDKIDLYNSYGVSECSICSTIYKIPKNYKSKITPGQPIPIGKPIPMVTIEILDNAMKKVAIGEIGEMYIGGLGLSKGYLNKKELTAERFLEIPELGGRFFRTGDKAKKLRSGDIVFLGRIDDQIKIRGIRIEPGEIENILNSHPLVSNSFVTLQINENDKKLIAYIEPYLNQKNNKVIRSFLKKHLPDYMVPNHIISVKKFPLTINGKLDKKAFPKIQNELIVDDFSDKENIYSQLKRTIASILKISIIRDEGNFFDEYGCDSLNVVYICVSFEEKTSIRIKYEWLYEHPNLKLLYAFITKYYKQEEEKAETTFSSEIDILWSERIKSKVLELEVGNNNFVKNGDYFLTGATGFVGCHILNEILIDSKKTVYCLVRKKNGIPTGERVLNSLKKYNIYSKKFESRIVTIEGDLDHENFGLAIQKYEELSRKVSKVFHIAAHMNHIAPYEILKKTNVKGVKKIIAFCIKTKLKTLHYSSSSSIFIDNDRFNGKQQEINEDFSLKLIKPGKFNGYSLSKYYAELHLQHLISIGFPCNVYRLDLISQNSINSTKTNQWIDILIEVCLGIKIVFNDFSNTTFAIDPVSKIAKAIIKLSKQSSSSNTYHVFSDKRVSLNDFLDKAINKNNDYKVLKFNDWCEYVRSYYSNTNSRITFMLQVLENINMSFSTCILKSEKTLNILQKENFLLSEQQ